jgi:hypothetical protein
MSPAGNVNAKKHTQCFLDGQVDGKGPKAFDAGRFTHCGKNYEDGFQRAVRVKVMMHKD